MAGIGFDKAGMHLTKVHPDSESNCDLVGWRDLCSPKLFQASPSGDWLFRYVGDIVIVDAACSLRPAELRHIKSRIIDEIFALCDHLFVRVRLGTPTLSEPQLDGRMDSLNAACFVFDERLGSLSLACRQFCQQLLTDSELSGLPLKP